MSQDTMIGLKVAVLTVSDTRTEDTDRSGQALVQRLEAAGHQLADKQIVIDDIYRIRAVVSGWIADPEEVYVRAKIVGGGPDKFDVEAASGVSLLLEFA